MLSLLSCVPSGGSLADQPHSDFFSAHQRVEHPASSRGKDGEEGGGGGGGEGGRGKAGGGEEKVSPRDRGLYPSWSWPFSPSSFCFNHRGSAKSTIPMLPTLLRLLLHKLPEMFPLSKFLRQMSTFVKDSRGSAASPTYFARHRVLLNHLPGKFHSVWLYCSM